tara:strand:- start:940 stop:1599 length:660 start_codon:yes stop_codon:yes gene_type:complete
MTGNELNSILALRVEDPAESTFTKQAKVDAINISQKSICNLVDNGYLTELESIAEGVSVSAGKVSFATASIDPLRGGITAIFDETNDKFCNMIEPKDVKRLENTYLAGTSKNPTSYVFQGTIYIKPVDVTVIDIWYLKQPTDFIYNQDNASTAGMDSQCELNPALQELVLDFAEAQLWRMDAKADRAQVAYNNALATIKVLNERYQFEKPKGVGTQGRG